MKRKNIKLVLLAVLASIAIAGCGTDDGKKPSADDRGKETNKVVSEKDRESKDKGNDKSETSGDDIQTSERSSGEEESISSDQTSAEPTDIAGEESTGGQSSTVNNAAENNTGGTKATSPTGNNGGGNNNNTPPSDNNSNNTPSSNNNGGNNMPGNTPQGNEAPVKVETGTTAAVSVGNANSQISDQNKDIVNNNKTEYTGTSNNSSSKKIYVSENSINYGYALAYVNGDTSRLNDTQKQIFAMVKPLIDNVMANYITDPEREKAIHDYIVSNCRYNIEDCTNLMEMEDYNFHPEGVFLRKKAVCQGYAESFKLCMDLLGIRCDIVTGYGIDQQGNEQAHAWNTVCLDNEWYQIDCTWDDPLVSVNGQMQDSGKINYSYFNITDSQMKRDHIYTYGTPCNGTRYGYDYFAAKEYGTIYPTIADFSSYVNSQLEAGKSSITAYVRCEGGVTPRSYMEENQIDYGKYKCTSVNGFNIYYSGNSISDTIYVIEITIVEN